MHSDRLFVIEALKAGVSEYLLKDSASGELARVIRAVADNRLYLCPTPGTPWDPSVVYLHANQKRDRNSKTVK